MGSSCKKTGFISEEALDRRFRSSSRDECNRDSYINEVLNNTCDTRKITQLSQSTFDNSEKPLSGSEPNFTHNIKPPPLVQHIFDTSVIDLQCFTVLTDLLGQDLFFTITQVKLQPLHISLLTIINCLAKELQQVKYIQLQFLCCTPEILH